MKKLVDEFLDRVDAGVPGIAITTSEPDAAIQQLAGLAFQEDTNWTFSTFDVDRGTRVYVGPHEIKHTWCVVRGKDDFAASDGPVMNPLDVLVGFPGVGPVHDGLLPDGTPKRSILALVNPHLYMYENPLLLQKLSNAIWDCRGPGRHIVLISHELEIPGELQGLFEAGRIRQELPDRADLIDIALLVDAGTIHDEDPNESEKSKESEKSEEEEDQFEDEFAAPVKPRKLELPSDPEEAKVFIEAAEAAAGLTRFGAEDAMSLTMARKGYFDPREIFTIKAQSMVQGSTGISLSNRDRGLDDFGGGQHIKDFCLGLLRRHPEDGPGSAVLRPRGIFCVGVPGSGKSILAECIAARVGRVVAQVNMAAMKSSLQGASYSNLQKALDTLDAMGNCLALFDEVEGQVSGGKQTGRFDGGTGGQMNSKLLTWLAEHESDVFTIATANSVFELQETMPEFMRPGRFDGMFFFDFPPRESKDAIWKIHLQHYGYLDDDKVDEQFAQMVENKELPEDPEWTGAEIEACCRLARIQEVSLREVGDGMPTTASRAKDTIASIREWAHDRCYSIDKRERYDKDAERDTGGKRHKPVKVKTGGSRRLKAPSKRGPRDSKS